MKPSSTAWRVVSLISSLCVLDSAAVRDLCGPFGTDFPFGKDWSDGVERAVLSQLRRSLPGGAEMD